MKARVQLSDQVLAYIGKLAPQPRKRLRDALHRLAEGRADVKALEGRLSGYHRLRAGSYRVVFHYRIDHGHPIADCIFVAERSLVYQLFEQSLTQT
ncbi:MAG: hypothetical protein IPK22_05895 [Verrucomicrobiaceae bacterium]|nr:hypothetical protein [Verrucomicrobiaceae bacterium]